MSNNVERIYLSREEVVERLHSLSPEVVARIIGISRANAYGTGLGAEDLLQEAVVRTLNESRKWPADVNVDAYLTQVIRSIASHRREKLEKSPEVLEVDVVNSDGGVEGVRSLDQMLMDESNTPCHEVSAEQLIHSIHQQFADDEAVLSVMRTQIEGWSREEGCERTGLTSREYDAALKRLRRGLDRQYGKRA
jgi:DNA-directed RNA polymerase specialized sigma24 family protein